MPLSKLLGNLKRSFEPTITNEKGSIFRNGDKAYVRIHSPDKNDQTAYVPITITELPTNGFMGIKIIDNSGLQMYITSEDLFLFDRTDIGPIPVDNMLDNIPRGNAEKGFVFALTGVCPS